MISKLENTTSQQFMSTLSTNVSRSMTLLRDNNISNSSTTMDFTSSLPQLSVSFGCGSGFVDFHFVTVCLGFSNSMMNPIVYSFMGAKFQKKLKLLFRRTSHQQSFNSRSTRRSFWSALRDSTIRRIRERSVDCNSTSTSPTERQTPAFPLRNTMNKISNGNVDSNQMSIELLPKQSSVKALKSAQQRNADKGLFADEEFQEISNGPVAPTCGYSNSQIIDDNLPNGHGGFEPNQTVCFLEEDRTCCAVANNKRLLTSDRGKQVWVSASYNAGVTL